MSHAEKNSPSNPNSSQNPFITNMISGFMIFLIALPLCLGIAKASGFPPIGGVITAIVGGLVASHLGSAYLTIKGPAAGLIVIAIGAVTDLGNYGLDTFDPIVGYKRALAVGVVAAVIQIIFSFISVAKLARVMPISVVHGMLAAIGVIIIAKQVPVLCGVKPEHPEPMHLLRDIPHFLMTADHTILGIGALAVAILVIMPMIKPLKKVPAPLVVLLLTAPLAMVLGVDAKFLVSLTGKTDTSFHLLDAIVFPSFDVVTSAPSIKYIIMFALVGTIESLLTVIAVDSMDPAKHVSNLDKDLRATGVSNLIASCIGGLPMISEVVRSKANLDAGATGTWSNFFHGGFLLLFVVAVPDVLQKIPLTALAAMLLVTGWRLAHPREFKHALEIGKDQLALFLVTCILTLVEDLLVGVFAGIILQFILLFIKNGGFKHLFGAQVQQNNVGDSVSFEMSGPVVFTNFLKVQSIINEAIDKKVPNITLDFSKATLVDHTVQECLDKAEQELDGSHFHYVGLDKMQPASSHKHATKWRRAA